ncbi:MAG: ABC transporter ATP-binding protein [Candidatus Sumerlaeota bacterium]
MIKVEQLRKVYGETTAVQGISFEVPKGEILGFLGPNGAGKSTTMRMLTGFTPPTSGRASIGGFDIVRQSRQVRSILGYLPESAPIYGEMTVEAYVDFIAEVKGLRGRGRKDAVGQALDECGLTHVAGRLLMNLSKGYRQRAALAQAVVGNPQVVILDEPTVGLDPEQIREIRDLIRGMAGRRTVILSTHILPEVSLTCSRVIIISNGRLVASGTPEHLETHVPRPNRIVVTVNGSPEQIAEHLRSLKNVRTVERRTPLAERSTQQDTPEEFMVEIKDDHDIRAEVSRSLVESGFELLEIRSLGLSLEEVFIHTVSAGDGLARVSEKATFEKEYAHE